MRHNLYGVELADTVPVVLGAIESVNYRRGTQHQAQSTSGAIYPTHVSINEIKPVGDFTSYALQDCLDQVGVAGLSIADLANGLNLYAYKHADGGGRASGANHRKFNMTQGIVVPNRISCDHRGDAMIAYDILPTWDGSNDPVTESDSASVPSAPTDDERFTIGPVTIGSVTVDELRNFQLDFGFNVKTEGADSDIYDTHVSIVDMVAILTLRSVKMETLAAAGIPRTGKAATHANSSFYLRKRLQSSAGFVANGTAEHIKGTMAGLAYIEDGFTGGGDNPAEVSLKLVCTFDGTNLPVAFTTASAIT